jgi:hypothetical protein
MPAGPASLFPGWVGHRLPGWASRRPPRLGLWPPTPAGQLRSAKPPPRLGRCAAFSGWAGFSTPGWAGEPNPARLVSFMSRLGQARIPLAQAGIPLARPDYLSPGRLCPLWAEIYSLRTIFFIRHRLQRLVPVLGRPLAQTGTSSIGICWSWETPLLRPAYSTLAIASLILRRG